MKLKSNLGIVYLLLIMLSISFNQKTSNNTPTQPESKCKPSTSKIRHLVRANWRAIQRTADFVVSEKGDFEIRDYGLDGNDLVVDIYSRGFMFDISFTVSFSAYFDEDCDINGDVLDCYNYRKH